MSSEALCDILGHEWKFGLDIWQDCVDIECAMCGRGYGYKLMRDGVEHVYVKGWAYWITVEDASGATKTDVKSFLDRARIDYIDTITPTLSLSDSQIETIRRWTGVPHGIV